jgi:hypothetical protein
MQLRVPLEEVRSLVLSGFGRPQSFMLQGAHWAAGFLITLTPCPNLFRYFVDLPPLSDLSAVHYPKRMIIIWHSRCCD